MRPESVAEFTFPDGAFWAADLAQRKQWKKEQAG